MNSESNLCKGIVKLSLIDGIRKQIPFLVVVLGLMVACFSLQAAEEAEINGTYSVQVACYQTYHEEVSYVVEPGKSKFSGVRHALNIPPALKKKLRTGMKVKIKGKKQAAVKKKMTKGAARKAMYKVLKNKEGLPLHSKDMSEIISKIRVKKDKKNGKVDKAQADAHDHGELKLAAVADDAEEVEVTIPAHVVVESIELVK